MKFRLIFLLILIFVALNSCSSKKNVVYLQNFDLNKSSNVKFQDYRIKVDDILKIDLRSNDPESKLLLDDNSSINLNSNKESILYNGYQVGIDGNIFFNEVGKVNVLGLTINQLREKLHQLIVEKGILLNPLLDIKVINSNFTILGEVNRPGRYDFLKNNINIFEAIGIAGDLTITGKRSDVKLIRQVDDKTIIKEIDLTNIDLIESEYFQLISNDIIIVNPNKTRINNAGLIGNSSTLITLLSFILSSIIVINN